MADIFDVLADATRREILVRLLDRSRAGAPGEVGVSELVAQLGISQPTVSKHLKVLRDAGLARVREMGQHRYYSLEPGPLETLEEWLAPFLVGGPLGATPDPSVAAASSPVFAAWAGSDVGDRMGRAAADTAHSARVAIEAAQEKLQGAQKRVSDKLPRWNRGD